MLALLLSFSHDSQAGSALSGHGGILSNIEQEESEDLRMVALDTLLSLMIGGCLGLWCRFLPWHCASFLCPSQPLGS